MDQRKIDPIDAETLQAAFDRALQIAGGDVRGPNFGGQENLVARHPGGTQARPDRRFVLVGGGGIDMPVTGLERARHQPGGRVVAQGPGAEPDGGNLGTVSANPVPDRFVHRVISYSAGAVLAAAAMAWWRRGSMRTAAKIAVAATASTRNRVENPPRT